MIELAVLGLGLGREHEYEYLGSTGIASDSLSTHISTNTKHTPICVYAHKPVMYQEPVKLDRLPIETLRRIASLGACEAALALSKVNRTLYAACNDRLVFKAIIDNRNGYGGPKWHHHLPLSMESPVSSWARYALADSKAAQDRSSSLDPERIAPWVPHLVVYHRKLFSEPELNLSSINSPSQIPLSIFPKRC